MVCSAQDRGSRAARGLGETSCAGKQVPCMLPCCITVSMSLCQSQSAEWFHPRCSGFPGDHMCSHLCATVHIGAGALPSIWECGALFLGSWHKGVRSAISLKGGDRSTCSRCILWLLREGHCGISGHTLAPGLSFCKSWGAGPGSLGVGMSSGRRSSTHR